jgi:glycine/D-amino acid oxidase-like deaminating enzyme/nitrite reductase/ring-hydroxylating ferredoxin subunit
MEIRRNSVWMRTVELPHRERLAEDGRVDICVVGAGIAGLTTAYLLARSGRAVTVLDDGEIGSGETSRTTAHLANALDDRYCELERQHGEQSAALAAESHTAAIDQIEAIIHDEQIDCEFTRLDGYLFVPPGDDVSVLDTELAAAHRAGLHQVERVQRAPLSSFDTGPALRFPQQGQFHPLKYLAGVAQAIERRGGRIFTNTHAAAIEGGTAPRIETTEGRVLIARAAVVATNTPVNDRVAVHTKQAAYRTYVIGVMVPRGSVPTALFWDTPDPYHYVRVTRGGGERDVLIVGGEDHKTGQADDGEERFARLEAWTRARFSMAEEITSTWSGQIMEPVDSLAFIGRNPGDDNVYIATGDSGNGMTHGTIAGMLLTDLIHGRENRWATLYDPSRITLRATSEFAKENVNVVLQYADLVTPGEIQSPEQLVPGSGAVLRRGAAKVALYRDEQGMLHELSAVCPHLGCVVAWNSTEKSWDCPCHGSRFEATGGVLNGPAIGGLKPI